MPQKVNPVGSIVVNAGFRRAQGLLVTLYGCLIAENERGAGEWQAEWQSIQELLQLCGGAVSRSLTMVDNLFVNESKMLDNLELSRGNVMSERVLQAMTRLLGRTEAYDIIREATIQSALNGTPLSDELQKVEAFRESFNSDQVQELFDPFSYLGSYSEFIDRTLDHWQEIQNTWKVPSGDRNID
jgi:3-carboxy-cis,cis-muconate cycloisomerase